VHGDADALLMRWWAADDVTRCLPGFTQRSRAGRERGRSDSSTPQIVDDGAQVERTRVEGTTRAGSHGLSRPALADAAEGVGGNVSR
jgi:hypothetical protein